MELDTIVAISTPVGEGAISIVRLSGSDSIAIVDQFFDGKSLIEVDSHTIHYGKLLDPKSKQQIDEVMVSILHGPKTYTRENIVEINCHGGIVATNRILQLMLSSGARLAEPGEFTKRAFLNGRIDLSQAEAVMDIIQAKSDEAMNIGLEQLDGRLSRLIRQLRQTLIETIAHVEVNIDYPEYDDVEEMSQAMMAEKTAEVYDEINKLINVAHQGKVFRDGIKTAIIGRPNVGKSSLLNTFIQEDKAIVTDIPGTTRDTLEELVKVRDIPLILYDTAGIRETTDLVEKIGVERSQKVMQEVDLVLFMLNYNEALSEDEKLIFSSLSNSKYIVIINKTDLIEQLDIDEVKEFAKNNPIIYTSIKDDKGIDELEHSIAQLFLSGRVKSNEHYFISNVRHIHLLEEAKSALEEAMNALEMDIPLDMVQIDVTRTWELLGEIIGETANKGLIDQLFSQFCLGK